SAAAEAPPAPATAPPAAPSADASADAVAVRQLILNSLSEGHPREAVEAYLRDHMGLMEPAVLVDAALNAQPPA
ncbi:MAG: hypothetical protein JWM98_1610, partial [Thermoleophilia bacterium]|nr:hypothetical protein [Thermoleophilia bacterium]